MLLIVDLARRSLERSPAHRRSSLEPVVRPFRELDNRINVYCLVREYACLAAVLGSTIWFSQNCQAWGVHWGWHWAVMAIAVVLVGALQHRLAGLGHEAAHFTLFKNKRTNELVSDLFCMFPIFATTHQYRLVHMAHHQYPNDWERDPDLASIGHSKLMHRFPMSSGQFVFNFFIRFFFPHVLIKYLWDVLSLSALGAAKSPYLGAHARRSVPAATLLGIGHLACLAIGLHWLNRVAAGDWLLSAAAGWWILGLAVIGLLPEGAFFQSPMRCAYSARTTAALRLTFNWGLLTAFGWLRSATGIPWGGYFWLLWVTPLFSSFAYFMLLRDVYQHANADTGRLTNTRVFFSDPFTKWAIWVYGMDMHVPHHLYPAVPHYRLAALHRALSENSPDYAAQVVECHGTFSNRNGRPTILAVMRDGDATPLNPPFSSRRAA